MNSCGYCPFKSKYKWVVQRHTEKKHNTDKQIFSCGNCEFMTPSEGEMTEHKLKDHDIIYKGYAETEVEDQGYTPGDRDVIKKRSWNHPDFK